MAEIGYGVAVKVLELLGSVTYQELNSAWGVGSRRDLIKLERTVKAIEAVLLDAGEKQASDHRLSIWLGELKDVLQDAENVLDEYQYRIRQKVVRKRQRSTSKKVSNLLSSSNPLAVRFEMARKIKGIRKRVEDIAAFKDEFNLPKGLVDRKLNMQERRDMTHSFVDPRNVIGRDDAKRIIICILLDQNENSSRNVDIVPIIGLGGLGKTTIAKLVYNDEQVVDHFQLRMWVCVSNDFNVTRLIKEILKSAIHKIDDNMGVDELKFILRGVLKDKKFLLVLDDVWNEDRNKWMEFKYLLFDGCYGSKIIVTTRKELVATMMGTAPTYYLDCLPQEDCLSLFVKLAFEEGEEKQYPNLLEIGNDIVKKCEGVPLAVRTLASLLYSKVDEREWKSTRDNEIWHLKQNEDDILPALRLSYNQLPFYLKQCFAYCSLFPKDYEFTSSQLVQFWMAHGILQSPDKEKQELEDIGELYIEELMSKSLFQDVYEDGFFTYSFKMHDLVHDLAISIAKGECSVVTKTSTLAAKVCHLLILESGQEVTTQLEKLSKVQTIIFQTKQSMSSLEACILRFKYLRLLDLGNSSFEVLPSFIGSLKHLRYLDLSGNRIIRQLPYSICKLHNLQTLYLGGCSNLERLPKGIRDIISLRFLVVTTKHTCLSEKAVGYLDSLRFLWIGDCENLKCLFEGMEGRLTCLRTLIVSKCPRLTSLSLSIKHLTALETLIIGDCKKLSLMEMEEEDNQDLTLSLQKLIIWGLPKLEVLPKWLQGPAITLQQLVIGECENLKALPEWLPCLKSLHTLRIVKCPKLLSLPEGMEALTALRQLVIEDCPELSGKCREEDFHKIAHVQQIGLRRSSTILKWLEPLPMMMDWGIELPSQMRAMMNLDSQMRAIGETEEAESPRSSTKSKRLEMMDPGIKSPSQMRAKGEIEEAESRRSFTKLKRLYLKIVESEIKEAESLPSELLPGPSEIKEAESLPSELLPGPSERNKLYFFFWHAYSPVMYSLYEVDVPIPLPPPPSKAVQDDRISNPKSISPILQLKTGKYADGMCCVQLGSILYFLGGEMNIDNPYIEKNVREELENVKPDVLPKVVYIFDLAIVRELKDNDDLLAGTPMNYGKARPLAFVADEKIYVIGSTIQDLEGNRIHYFEMFDPKVDKWSVLENPPEINVNTIWVGHAVVRRKALLVGWRRKKKHLYCFDLDTCKWASISFPDYAGNFSGNIEFVGNTFYGCYYDTVAAIAPLVGEEKDELKEEEAEEKDFQQMFKHHRLFQVSEDLGMDAIFNVPPQLQYSSSLLHLGKMYFCYVRTGMPPHPDPILASDLVIGDDKKRFISIVIFQDIGETCDSRFFKAKFLHSEHYVVDSPFPNDGFIRGCYVFGSDDGDQFKSQHPFSS